MNRNHPIFTYILIFLVLSMILKLVGVINFSTAEIFGYAFIFYGISSVFTSLGRGNKLPVFIGTVFFLTGILLFVISNYEFLDTGALLVPAILYISGIGIFMIYLEDLNSRIYLLLSLLLLIAASIITFRSGTVSFNSFLHSALSMLNKYWPVILIILGIFFIIKREEKR